MSQLNKTSRTTVNRSRNRATYQRETINSIIDAALIGHLAFQDESGIHSIPMPFWRDEEFLYCHCSVASRLVALAINKTPVCISFTILDGMVLAKSALHHSMNYRSVVVYGRFDQLDSGEEKAVALKGLMDWVDESRWDQVRQPNKKELNATAVLRLPLTEAVAKVRTGPAEDKLSDLDRAVWTGVLPYLHLRGEPEPDQYSVGSYD